MAGLPGNNACVNVGATVVLQRANHRIGVDLIARAIQITDAVVKDKDVYANTRLVDMLERHAGSRVRWSKKEG